ncbi:MAG: hypothetical protein ACYDB2_06665 [Acidimicrobiales bacterium]
MRRTLAALARAIIVTGSVVSGVSVTSDAATVKTAMITGSVIECGPGPVVESPPAPHPSPKPASVILMHDGVRYARDSINFRPSPPWSGSFSFRVPAGRYDVISTYFERQRWVNVIPGSRAVVNFAPIACPL